MEAKKSPSLAFLYPVALVLALATIGLGAYLVPKNHNWTMVAAGAASLVAVLVAWPIGTAQRDGGTAGGSIETAFAPVHERLEQFSVMLNEISEQQLLSDRAKAVAYREKDREALRRAIAEDIQKRDWEGALVLADEMDTAFGYKQEAERVRENINAQFAEHIRRQVTDTSRVIDRHVQNQQWAAAFREAERLRQQHPVNDQIANLPAEIESRRQQYKASLLESYHDLVARKDVDGAVVALKKLDFYLTAEEAAGMQESARNVFREKMNNLRTQFTLAVQDHKWTDAVRIGDSIVHDFPNTQMAKEVRENLEALRAKANERNLTTV